jgi:hypothetical protein
MTTFQVIGATLRSMAALLTTLVVLGMAAPAQSAPAFNSRTTDLDCKDAKIPDSVRKNQYVLLLFFSDDDAGRAAVKQLFKAEWPETGRVTAGLHTRSHGS